MQLIRGLHNLSNVKINAQVNAKFNLIKNLKHVGSVVTIGNFDGVHLGHQAILREVKNRAFNMNCLSAVMFFEPQPREFFDAQNAPLRISSLQDKLLQFKRANIDLAICLKFNQYLANLTAQDFIHKILVKKLKVKHVIIGNDFCFGKNRAGNFELLQMLGQKHSFSVSMCKEFKLNNKRISSTNLRCELSASNLTAVKQMLGRSFSITGRVVHGNKLARTLNAPTANLNLLGKKLPFNGVFVALVQIGNFCYNAVANLGVRPTVTNDNVQYLEVHILNFNADLYGRKIKVLFLHKLRAEQKFSNLDELCCQIAIDINSAKQYFINLDAD